MPSIPRRQERRPESWQNSVVSSGQNVPVSATINSSSSSLVTVPLTSHSSALAKIESLMESMLDAVIAGVELPIPYRTVRSAPAGPGIRSSQNHDRQSDIVRFPGRTIQEAKRFEALFCILQLSHEALLSGKLITKRNIYYQNPELFKSQSMVDDMVDNLAFTLGVGRTDLNIVAAAKGLVSGPIDLVLNDGSVNSYDLLGSTGSLLPPVSSIQQIDFRCIKWVLVIEKEATFRTLAASGYAMSSQLGHGILLTGKGFPDLDTRRFLCLLHSLRSNMNIFALIDFDPDGIAIMRTYKNGSRRLEHEQDATVPRLRWLGIHSNDILSSNASDHEEGVGSDGSGASQDGSSQESGASSSYGSQQERPAKRARMSRMNPGPIESVCPLTQRDRKKAVEVMKEIIAAADGCGEDEFEQMLELQRMLLLNIKAEMQAVDNFGDITRWLDAKLPC